MRALTALLAICLLAAPAVGDGGVELTCPSSLPGEIWPCGRTCRVAWWTYNPASFDCARLEVTVDGGLTWNVIVSCVTNVGGYNWAVPAMVDSDECRIKVIVARDCSPLGRVDINEIPFVITEGPTATVLPIEADSLVSGGCIEVSLEVENHSGRQLTLWYDLDMADPALNIHDDPANDLQFTIGAGAVKTVTRPFCMPWGVPEGTWTLKAILWSVRDGDRYAGPKLYDSGWIHPTTVATGASSWGAVKAAGGAARR